ncbi:MAG TPA: glycerophosphodiester phosphodiesterase [Acidimicrobiales bacterium]|nr:glycerophosphodiester phosphodiesterase [Acidimicrobiales bacterium]
MDLSQPAPSGSRLHPFLEGPRPAAFAHRGGAGDWPENTMPAFQSAADMGFTYFETDAHVTSDGVVVALHDDSLDRVTDRTGLISELTWAEVSRARVAGIEPIPSLEELLVSFPDVRFNIDPKADRSVGPLMDLLTRRGDLDRVCIGSFSDSRLRRIAEEFGSRVCLGLGPRAIGRLTARSLGLPVGSFEGRCAQVPTSVKGVPLVTRRFVDAAHRAGAVVHVWTIDDPLEMDRLLDLGVDGIMTDRPRILREVLERRGQWRRP